MKREREADNDILIGEFKTSGYKKKRKVGRLF